MTTKQNVSPKLRFGLMPYVDELREHDHAFISPEGAERLSKPFGFVAKTHVERADPTAFKGLTLFNGATEARGVDAQDLAIQICNHVGVDYEFKWGRGSQLRACCDALEKWLKG